MAWLEQLIAEVKEHQNATRARKVKEQLLAKSDLLQDENGQLALAAEAESAQDGDTQDRGKGPGQSGSVLQ